NETLNRRGPRAYLLRTRGRPAPTQPPAAARAHPFREGRRMRVIARTTLFLWALACASTPLWAEPVAIVAAAHGRVTVTPARAHSTRLPASFGMALERGDRLSVDAKGRATLFFDDGNIVELGAGSTLTIGGRVAGSPPAGSDRVGREAFRPIAEARIRGPREPGLLPAPRLRSGEAPSAPEPLSPRNTDVLDPRPALSWREVPGASRYVVTLAGLAGPVWSRESGSTT